MPACGYQGFDRDGRGSPDDRDRFGRDSGPARGVPVDAADAAEAADTPERNGYSRSARHERDDPSGGGPKRDGANQVVGFRDGRYEARTPRAVGRQDRSRQRSAPSRQMTGSIEYAPSG